jgi:hypothetical protein
VELHLKVPVHDKPAESLIGKPRRRWRRSKKGAGKKLRSHTIRRAACIESGHDKFDEKVTAFLQQVGEPNLIGVHIISYEQFDVGVQKIMTDYGVLVDLPGLNGFDLAEIGRYRARMNLPVGLLVFAYWPPWCCCRPFARAPDLMCRAKAGITSPTARRPNGSAPAPRISCRWRRRRLPKNLFRHAARRDRVLRIWPLSDYAPRAAYLVGRCQEVRHKDEAAFNSYQKIIEKYPKSGQYNEVLWRQYAIAGRFLNGEWFRLWNTHPALSPRWTRRRSFTTRSWPTALTARSPRTRS